MAYGISLPTPATGSTSWEAEMENLRFGDDEFAVVVEEFEFDEQVQYSQMLLRLEGRDWRIGGQESETLGVVVPKLVDYCRNGAVRHWGSFADARTPSDVIDRVVPIVFSDTKHSGPWVWDSFSALHAYVLSSLFDANLGASCVVVVRGLKHETIIVQAHDDSVDSYEVPLASFDRAIDDLAAWYEAVSAETSA